MVGDRVAAATQGLVTFLGIFGRDRIYEDETGTLVPNSMVAISSRELWIGGQTGVLRMLLVKHSNYEAWQAQWFLPLRSSTAPERR